MYEGIIESVNLKKKRAKVKFIGYENEDTVDLANLLKSRGEEWREQQIDDATYDLTEDITQLLEDSSEVFSNLADIQSFDKLDITDNNTRVEKKEKKHKSDHVKIKKKKSEKEKRKVSDLPPFGLDTPFDLNSGHPFPDLTHLNPGSGEGFPAMPNLPGAFDSLLNLERDSHKPPVNPTTGFPSLLIPPPPPLGPLLAQGSGSTQQDEVSHQNNLFKFR